MSSVLLVTTGPILRCLRDTRYAFAHLFGCPHFPPRIPEEMDNVSTTETDTVLITATKTNFTQESISKDSLRTQVAFAMNTCGPTRFGLACLRACTKQRELPSGARMQFHFHTNLYTPITSSNKTLLTRRIQTYPRTEQAPNTLDP